MVNQPLIVIVFDGLLGVFHKNSNNEIELFTRNGIYEGINMISNACQVALFTTIKDEAKIKYLIQSLKKRKITFDAVYRKIGNESIFDNYDQLYIDF